MPRTVYFDRQAVTLDGPFFHRCIEALETDAIMEAGQSQHPDLIKPEDTQQWQDAQALRAALRQGMLP